MIGIILVGHGRLADEFLHVVEHIMGPREAVRTVAIGAEDDMEQRRAAIIAAVAEVDQGQGVIIVTDMFGGTPSNLAISVVDRDDVQVIAGMNLPLLIKLFSVRESMELPEAIEQAQESGRKYITIARNMLSGTSHDG